MFHEEFHPEVLAVTPFLVAYLYARRKRWLAYSLWMVLAVSWKEDVALAAAVFGLILAVRGSPKAGLWTAGAAITWIVIVTQVMIPAFNDQGTFYSQFFGELGDTPREVVWTGVTNPTEIVVRLDRADAAAACPGEECERPIPVACRAECRDPACRRRRGGR